MALTVNVNNQTAAETQMTRAAAQKQQKAQKRKTFFVGNTNLDPIAQKRKEAQSKAWRVISSAWEQDQAFDADVEKRKTLYDKNKEALAQANDELNSIKDQRAAMMEEYEIDPDSQEQKDLELMERYQDQQKGLVSGERLSLEEYERAQELMEQPMTDYQTRALELNDREGVWEQRARDAKINMNNMVEDIKDMNLASLQSTPMRDAKHTADAIMEAASEEIIGMVVKDMKENVDETMEETKEKIKENAEKKEEQEEELAETKMERAIQKAMIEGTQDAVREAEAEIKRSNTPSIDTDEISEVTQQNSNMSEAQQKLQDLAHEMKLIEADLKGIKVDTEV